MLAAATQPASWACLDLLEQVGALGDVAEHGVPAVQHVGAGGGQLRLLRGSNEKTVQPYLIGM